MLLLPLKEEPQCFDAPLPDEHVTPRPPHRAAQVGVPTGRIFIINPKGELRMASTTIRSSTLSTLRAINEIASTIFPPLLGPGAATWGATGGGAAASDGEAEARTTTKAGVTAVVSDCGELRGCWPIRCFV